MKKDLKEYTLQELFQLRDSIADVMAHNLFPDDQNFKDILERQSEEIQTELERRTDEQSSESRT